MLACVQRFDVDRIVHLPDIDFCAAIHLDGPLAGTLGYAVNRMGFQVGLRWRQGSAV